jgi:hypothetical protein
MVPESGVVGSCHVGAYYMNEAVFDLAEAGFVDRTVTYLEGTSPSGARVVLLVERHVLPAGKSLRQAVRRHVSEAQKRLRGYAVILEREITVADAPAIDLGVRWRDDDGTPVYTRQAHLVLGTSWLIVAGEAPLGDREFCDGCVDRALGSLRLRGD